MSDRQRSSNKTGGQENCVLPLSSAQRGIWFAQQLNTEATPRVFKIAEYLEIEGIINPVILSQAIRLAYEETDSLHQVFAVTESGPVQYAGVDPDWMPSVVDFSRESDPEASATHWIQQDINRDVNLATGPLFSFAVLKLSDRRYWYLAGSNHLVMDGFAAQIFASRVAEIYTALIEEQSIPSSTFSPLSALIESEIHYRNSPQYEKDRQYWLDQMQGRPEPLSLSDKRATCTEIVRRQRYLPRHTNDSLRALAKSMGSPLPQLLIALTAIYLHRVTGDNDFVLGCPMTGRVSKLLRHLPAMMSNVLPLRLTIDTTSSLTDVVGQVKRRIMSAVRHQRFRGESLSAELGVVNTNDSLFLTHINILPFEYDMRFAGLPVKAHNLSLGPIDDLSINLCDRGEEVGLELCIDANRALYSDESLHAHFERLFHFYTRITESTVNLAVGRFPLLTQNDIDELGRWNDTAKEFGDHQPVYQLVEHQAVLHPQQTALEWDGGTVSYDILNKSANQLAYYLRHNGIVAEQRVAVCCDRGENWFVALLAILKAGGAYVPIDPNYPLERIEYMLDDSEPLLMLSDGTVDFSELACQVPVIDLNHDREQWCDNCRDNLPQPDYKPSNLAYVIYTSGSTGKPKGVLVEHHTLTNLVHWHNQVFDVVCGTCASSVAGMGFDAAVWEIWPPLCVGGYVCMPALSVSRDPLQLVDWWVNHPIEVGFLPTPIAELAFARNVAPATLRYLLVGGDKLTRHAPAGAHYQLVNNYGPTEATVVATSGVLEQTTGLHIGRPIANSHIYILSNDLQRMPQGVTGEIYIGGAGVARGYLNRDEQTLERFLPDPFSDVPGARMYRTGDLGRWLADGTIDYQGRNDSQVKIRGFRIELGEIANALQDCDGVQNAVVTTFGRKEEVKRLLAYYTTKDSVDWGLDKYSLQTRLADVLPTYMVPSAYIQLERIPLTANGKVDYRSLPEPDHSAFIYRDYEAPVTDLECLLADIWQDLLHVEQVGRNDNFFELGGHSLLAVQLIEQLRQHGRSLAIKSLFTHPSLGGLAQEMELNQDQTPVIHVPENKIPPHCERITPDMLPLISLDQAQIDDIVSQVPGGPENIQDIYPLAPLQEGILFHHMLATKGDPYITRAIKSFASRQELNQFVIALRAVIHRHDILRTGIIWDGLDQPVQVVWRRVMLEVKTLELEEADKVEALKTRFDPDITRINVQHAPMMEVYVTEDGDHQRWLLCMMMHHLCFDHTTLELMIEEIHAHLRGCEAQLPQALPFRNFVYQSRLNNDVDAQKRYFTERLADIDEPCTPFGLLDVQGDGRDMGEMRWPIDDGLAAKLRQVAKDQGVSTASLFHLAWGLVIQAATGQDDVVFGTVLFGRMAGGDGANRVLGMFLNTLPLRLSLANLTIDQAVQDTHYRLAELLDYEHGSLSLAQQCSGVAHQMPLFSALINYRYDGGSKQLDMESTPVELLYAEERTNYPMVISINDNPGKGFSLDIQVANRIGCPRIGHMMVRALTSIVSAVTASQSMQVTQLNVVSAQEVTELVDELNQTHLDINAQETVVSLFDAHALTFPDDVAIEDASGAITYQSLQAQANQLARYLCRMGVEKDQRVALCFDRSIVSVIAMLAVLKAGGAYVPMDPNYPADRLKYMVEDSCPILVLTDGIVDLNQILADSLVAVKNILTEQDWALESATQLTDVIVNAFDLAYVIYTSGSTGKPKGVMVEHRNLNHLVQWHNHLFEVTRGTHCSAVAGVGFDASVWEIWPPLAIGAQLHLPSLAISRDPDALLNWWQDTPLEVGFLSTPIAELALKRKLTHPSLRVLLVGGDRLNRAPDKHASFVLVNNYGPTETTVVATSGDIQAQAGLLDIGRPISNASIYILDHHGKLLPRGVKGEIYIGGKGVARGYMNLKEMTAERFVPNPFVREPGARMYRTGDLGRWLDDGTIEYLGRNDSQVKIRGFRIELGEISACLNTHAGVEEAVVSVTKTSNKQLIAHYVGQSQPEPLKAYLAARLPEYMVPVAYVKVAVIPLTPNGKVDYRSLPEPASSDYVMQAYLPPEGDIEQNIATIWQRLLGVHHVGRNDSFFELGGHSMLAVQFLNEARQLGYELSLSSLFTSSRLADIADAIQRHGSVADSAVALRPIQGAQRPLFIVPEASGEMMYAPLLASYIDHDIPVYGLSAPDRTETPFKTIEAAAARFARMMRNTQPVGPYRMTGISLGGTLAWEIAQQLLGQDQEVEYVGIVDTTALKPNVARHELEVEMTEMQQLTAMSKEVFDGLAADILSLNENDTPDDGRKSWMDYYLMASEMGMLPSGWSEDYYRSWLLHREGILKADYHYQALPLNMDLLIAEQRPTSESDDDGRFLCWDRFMPPERIRTALIKETNHYHVFVEPYIGYMGEVMSQGIHRREAEYARGNGLTIDTGYHPVSVLKTGHYPCRTLVCLLDSVELLTGHHPILEQLDDSWRVLGITPRGLDGVVVPHTTVEAAASCYWESLKHGELLMGTVQLMGHNTDGWIVAEMAQLMEKDGRQPDSVLMVGTPEPHSVDCDVTDVEVMIRWCQLLERNGFELGLTAGDITRMTHVQRIEMLYRLIVNQPYVACTNVTLGWLKGLLRIVAAQMRMPYELEQSAQTVKHCLFTELESETWAVWQEKVNLISFVKAEAQEPARAQPLALSRLIA